jgi:hypothetical protein
MPGRRHDLHRSVRDDQYHYFRFNGSLCFLGLYAFLGKSCLRALHPAFASLPNNNTQLVETLEGPAGRHSAPTRETRVCVVLQLVSIALVNLFVNIVIVSVMTSEGYK